MNKIILMFILSTIYVKSFFPQDASWNRLTIRDENDAGIGQYFDVVIDSISISADTTLDFYLIPNLGIQDSKLREKYSSFLEMLKRNTGNEINYLQDEETTNNPVNSMNKNWGDHINVFIGDEFWNNTDGLVRNVINELNSGLGYEYFRESSGPVVRGWNFDYTDVEGLKDRGLNTVIQTDGAGNPIEATFYVSGIFHLAEVNEKALNDFYYRLRDNIAGLLLFNKSYDKALIETGMYDNFYFQITKFSEDFFNILKTSLVLTSGRNFSFDYNELNKSPIANAGPDIEIKTEQTVILDASNSIDTDGQIKSYKWRQMFETKFGTEYMTSNIATLSDSLAQVATFTPDYPGNYKFKLTVTDNEGLTNSDYINIKVYPNSKEIKMKGLNSWQYYDPRLIDEVAPAQVEQFVVKDHANWIEIAPMWWMENKYSVNIHPLGSFADDAPGYTIPDSALVKLITMFHNKGLKVLLRPTLEIYLWAEWRGIIEPTDWDQWFASYEVFIAHYAQIAQQTSVELFSIGNELMNSNGYTDKWINVISKVRDIYKGDLTYSDSEISAGLSRIKFWDKLDVISGSGYLPITGKGDYWDTGFPAMKDPPFSIFLQSVENSINKFYLPAYQQYQKPVLLIEVGIGNYDGANLSPADYDYSNQTMDNREQADFYEALLQVISEKSWISGIFFFEYDIKTDFNFINSDWPLAHNPKDKPAGEVVRYWYND